MRDWKTPFRENTGGLGKTLREFAPVVGSRFRIYPHDNAWWEVKEIKERGAVIELWSTQGHKDLWEWDMIVYPLKKVGE